MRPLSCTAVESEALVKCYLASPLGFTEAGRHYHHEVYPWSLTSAEEIERARKAGGLHEALIEIGRRNARAIRDSPLFAALLDGQEPDSGTVAELGYAAGLGKRCFGLRTDLRQAGEDGAVNLQVEAFVLEGGGRIVGTLAELVDALRLAAGEL
jgi:nucleoside 2-deoxyribosyltransferase